MKKSGLDELESLNLDWNPGKQLMSQSILWCEANFLPSDQNFPYLNLNKQIHEEKDITNPFTIRYEYGYLR